MPSDHARQTLAEYYIDRQVGRRDGRPWRVLDLGCGAGNSVDLFRARDAQVEWVGLDLAEPYEGRTRTDAHFETFDGRSIPFEPERFDLVYCKQVLEHVRRPTPLLAEVRRVLAPGGYFAGSTSQLEPYHGLSLWNYTPLGLKELLDEVGLDLLEVRPGIDGITLVAHRLFPRREPFDRWWARWWGGQSPLNRLTDAYGRLLGYDARAVNATKLIVSGQFAFLARRRDSG